MKKTRKSEAKETRKSGRKRLILLCGLPGTGKSSVAHRIAEKTGSLVFSTDVVRKELFSKPKYTENEKRMVYNLLFEMAERFLDSSDTVVMDGTFYKKELRERAKEIADKNGSNFHIIEVVCCESDAKQRLGRRILNANISDADFCVHKKIKGEFESIKEEHLVLDTGKVWEKKLGRFLDSI
jgi:predicted kinase